MIKEKKDQAKKVKSDHDLVRDASDECVASSQYLLEILEEFILTGDVSQSFMDMQFRDETFQESRDMFVIVNIIK